MSTTFPYMPNHLWERMTWEQQVWTRDNNDLGDLGTREIPAWMWDELPNPLKIWFLKYQAIDPHSDCPSHTSTTSNPIGTPCLLPTSTQLSLSPGPGRANNQASHSLKSMVTDSAAINFPEKVPKKQEKQATEDPFEPPIPSTRGVITPKSPTKWSDPIDAPRQTKGGPMKNITLPRPSATSDPTDSALHPKRSPKTKHVNVQANMGLAHKYQSHHLGTGCLQIATLTGIIALLLFQVFGKTSAMRCALPTSQVPTNPSLSLFFRAPSTITGLFPEGSFKTRSSHDRWASTEKKGLIIITQRRDSMPKPTP